SIDELPQLWNILRGEMSLVGPRPYLFEDFKEDGSLGPQYEAWAWDRHLVPPGLTGLWQVSGRNDLPVTELVSLDLWYVSHRSVLLDLWILAKTIPAVFKNRGAY